MLVVPAEQSKNFVVYKLYCSNYKKSMDAIQRAKQIPAFAEFLQVRVLCVVCV
jgi:hypothetical protein